MKNKLNNECKIYIKLKAFDLKQLNITLTRILHICKKENYTCNGAISLPTQKRIYCVLRSPHVNKDAREHFEIRTYTKLLVLNRTTIFNLKLFIPSGVKLTLLEKN
jgi:small subunit ribosomal protein S10